MDNVILFASTYLLWGHQATIVVVFHGNLFKMRKCFFDKHYRLSLISQEVVASNGERQTFLFKNSNILNFCWSKIEWRQAYQLPSIRRQQFPILTKIILYFLHKKDVGSVQMDIFQHFPSGNLFCRLQEAGLQKISVINILSEWKYRRVIAVKVSLESSSCRR